MTVAVITDSAAALPREVAEEAGVAVVPLWITLGGRPYRDGELSLEEVLRRIRAGESFSTSGPSPGDVLRVIEDHAGPDGAVVLTVARRLSSTHEAARAAARLAGSPVRVVDSAAAVGAQALVVLAAAERARAGASLEEVEAVARHVAGRVRLVARLVTLEWLARGGRVPGAAAWAGRWLGLRPLIQLRGGSIRPLRPARSEEAARARMVAMVRRTQPRGGRLHVVALHALAPEGARDLLDAVRVEWEPASALVSPFGPVIVAHTGPDLVGLAWWWEEPGLRG